MNFKTKQKVRCVFLTDANNDGWFTLGKEYEVLRNGTRGSVWVMDDMHEENYLIPEEYEWAK